MTPIQILQNQFGYSSFRLEQETIIHSVLNRKDTFALMPTGGGKSLCYQIPALMFEGLTLVISPLIALMKDQVDALRVNGVDAAYINSTQSYREQDDILSRAKSGKLKLLYLAPERLLRNPQDSGGNSAAAGVHETLTGNISPFLKTIMALNISLIAIDEAHCISHWGHDFRPEYLMLAQLKRVLPEVPMIALTATADSLTRKDIVDKLALNDAGIFISSFNRGNIRYTVEAKEGSLDKLLTFLDKRKDDSGIIYCLSRSATERLAEDLVSSGYRALPYHAGLERNQRTKHQEMFLRDDVRIIVATIAFGMGINKSNVRFVVHMDLPKNIESYYQETGRAGRDGLDSDALLFYSYGDVHKLKRFAAIEGNPEQTEIAFRKLDQMAMYGTLTTCRRKYLLNYFDEKAGDHCGNCDICLTTFETYDGTVEAQKVLSAVSRLQERFGASYIVDFLRGSASSKIPGEHKALKTYGVGAEFSKEHWHHTIRNLIDGGYLVKTGGMYPVLNLSDKSAAVLKGDAKIMLARSNGRTELEETVTPYETVLFQRLKELRKELAYAENVPAYIILSDATLMELATYLPQGEEELGRISGFGQVKLEKYGRKFAAAIAEYCREHVLESRIQLKVPKRLKKERPEKETETKAQSFELFMAGHPLDKIAELRGLKPSTIEEHLAFYVQQGKLPIEKLIDPSRITTIRHAIDANPGPALTPIRDYLGSNYTYGEIRWVRAHLERSASSESRTASL